MSMGVYMDTVSVSFFGKEVLHGVSAHFAPNSLSVLLGRSGSGKTTLLRSINRLNEEFEGATTSGQVVLTSPTGNYVVYPHEAPRGYKAKQTQQTMRTDPASGSSGGGGPDVWKNTGQNAGPDVWRSIGQGALDRAQLIDLTELRLRVGMVFQTPNVFPVSVYQNIAMPLTLVGGCSQKEAESKVHEALQLVGLWNEVKDGLRKPAERLSGGQQQRLCLARVLALRPQVLLLDEPTASLDVHSGRHIENVLLELAQKYTVIMVSHGISQARRLGGKILVCKEGHIICELQAGGELSEELLEGVV